jgi:hypothetical protein
MTSRNDYILASDAFEMANALKREIAIVADPDTRLSLVCGGKSMTLLDDRAIAHVHPINPRLIDPRLGFHPSETDIAFSRWRARNGHRLGWHGIISAAGVTVFPV